MKITCASCSVVLNLPDEQIPKDVPEVTATCPKCGNPVVIRFGRQPQGPPPAAGAPPSPTPPPAATEPPPAAPPGEEPARSPAAEPEPEPAPEEDFGEVEDVPENARLALVCFDDAAASGKTKAALERLEYLVHVPEKPGQGVFWLRRYQYRLVLVHEAYGGPEAVNAILRHLAPLDMSIRRHICVGLVGPGLKSLDNMAAFAMSVNFTVGEDDLDKIEDLCSQAVADNDNFFAPFNEALKAAGKA